MYFGLVFMFANRGDSAEDAYFADFVARNDGITPRVGVVVVNRVGSRRVVYQRAPSA